MKKSLSLPSANLLFLITMLLIVTLGSVIQTVNLPVGLILTEVFLILLPAFLFLRRGQVSFVESLRLRPISPLIAFLCVGLGVSTHLFSRLIEGIMALLTGMQSVPLPEGSLPSGALDSALFFLALAFFAPVCEEILFRGAIQTSYESWRSARFAIVITGFMFAFYHMRLSGLPALLPVAFILGYVAWRTHSIYASMLVHFGMNATSALNTLMFLQGKSGLPFNLWIALGALVVAVAILVLIRRLQPAPSRLSSEETMPEVTAPSGPTWLRTYWPLLGASLIYLGVAGITLATALSPQTRASGDIHFIAPQINRVTISHYQITNRAGEVVGDLTCKIAPHTTTYGLDCTRNIQAYEVKLTSSYISDGTHTDTWSATWDAKTLSLVNYSFKRENADGVVVRARIEPGRLIVDGPNTTDTVELEKNTFLEYEWPWRANVLQTNAGDLWKVPFGFLSSWDETEEKSIPTVKTEYIQVYADETISLPAGEFTGRKFSLAGQTVWYANYDTGFPRPVQFDDGMVTYKLEK